MFNNGFYPTPEHVVRRMLQGANLTNGTRILEPSAGKGDILDALRKVVEQRFLYNVKYYACEIEPELVSILEGKGYPVLARDFLTYNPTLYFDLILMNPPFADAEDHILHAWEVLGQGTLISLAPSYILDGKNSRELVLKNLIEKHGGTVMEIGPVFRNAERPTNVPVVIIKIEKAGDPLRIDFTPENDQDHEYQGPAKESGIVLPGYVNQLVTHYNVAMAECRRYLTSRTLIERAIDGIGNAWREGENPLKAIDNSGVSSQDRYNAYMEALNNLAWNRILDHPDFQGILTERARKMVEAFRSRQKQVDFNVDNLRLMFDQIVAMKDDLLRAAIDDVFDELTKYHPENRVHIEGWKSDTCWRVARKVVLPGIVCLGVFGEIEIDYGYSRDKLNDIDRALCFLMRIPFSKIDTVEKAIDNAKRIEGRVVPGRQYLSQFFWFRCYKKGTIHLEFRDEELLAELNYQAARNRGWLPDGHHARSESPKKPKRQKAQTPTVQPMF